MTIAPASWNGRRISSADGTVSLHYKNLPGPYAIARVWSIQAHATTSSTSITVTIGAGTATVYPVSTSSFPVRSPIIYIEPLSAKVTTATDATVSILVGSTATVQIDSISCAELPRYVLNEDATELGVDLDSLFPQDAITDLANQGAHAVAELADALAPRRTLLDPYHREWSTSSASYVDVYEKPLPALPPYLGSATASCAWTVFASMSAAGNAGTLRITAASGDVQTVTLSPDASAYAWTTTGTVTLKAEDPTEDDGLPASTWETVQLAAKVDSGGGAINVSGFAVWST